MPTNPAPSIQAVTDGRLTLKKAQLDFLGSPSVIEVTYGPGRSVLLHNPQKRAHLVQRLLGDAELLDSDQFKIERRLSTACDECAVDDSGRIRVPQMFVARAKLEEKGSKATVVASARYGWLELWKKEEFDRSIDEMNDEWMEVLNRVARVARGEKTDESR